MLHLWSFNIFQDAKLKDLFRYSSPIMLVRNSKSFVSFYKRGFHYIYILHIYIYIRSSKTIGIGWGAVVFGNVQNRRFGALEAGLFGAPLRSKDTEMLEVTAFFPEICLFGGKLEDWWLSWVYPPWKKTTKRWASGKGAMKSYMVVSKDLAVYFVDPK